MPELPQVEGPPRERTSGLSVCATSDKARYAPPIRPRVNLDRSTGDAYISLGDIGVGGVKRSVPLMPEDTEPEAMGSLVLDFDRDGRLVGIEVSGANTVLRPELLDDSETL